MYTCDPMMHQMAHCLVHYIQHWHGFLGDCFPSSTNAKGGKNGHETSHLLSKDHHMSILLFKHNYAVHYCNTWGCAQDVGTRALKSMVDH